MSVTVSPPPYIEFQNPNNSGAPAAGFLLFTYEAGTTTKQNTWTDSTQTVLNSNPIVLDSNGMASVWLDPTLSYKYVLASPTDSDPPTSPLRTQDNIQGTVTQSTIGALVTPTVVGQALWPQTQAELTASVTPLNYTYPPGHVDRYGNNSTPTPGLVDMTGAFQAAINQARAGGADVVWGDTGIYQLSSSALDCTFSGSGSQYGLNFRQISTPSTNFNSAPGNLRCGLWVTHNDYCVFDLTGCNQFTFYDLSAVVNPSTTSSAPTTGSYPKICFLTARNSTGESNFPRFRNTRITGYFSMCVLYNFASENGIYEGNYWSNSATDAGAAVVAITANNYFRTANAVTSRFATIYASAISCIDHEFIGGQLALLAPSSTSDVFYLDGIEHLKVFGPWLSNGGGRSYFYCDMTNGPSNFVKCYALQGERTTAGPSFGALFSNAAGTATGWNLNDTYWKVSSYSFATAGSTPVIDTLHINNLIESATKGINVVGTLQNSYIDFPGNITVGTSSANYYIGTFANFSPTTRSRDIFVDRPNGAISLEGSIGIAGASPPGQQTGWGTPTGGSVVNNFPGSSATTAQCGSAITEIIIMLKALGLYAA